MQQRPSGMYQQGGSIPQGVPPNAMMGARGPPAQGFSPMRHGAGPMVSNQSTPGKRPADNRNPPPMGKGYVRQKTLNCKHFQKTSKLTISEAFTKLLDLSVLCNKK